MEALLVSDRANLLQILSRFERHDGPDIRTAHLS
jgi:hypothetical protein